MSGQEPGGKFDPTRYLRQLQGKGTRGGSADYLDIKWRLVWLRSEHPDARIETEHVTITNDQAIFKAIVAIPGGGSASGYGSETARDFGDYIEKAETKALGRALAALGYGTQFARDFEDEETRTLPGNAPIDPLRVQPVSPRPEPTTASSPVASRATPSTPRPEPIPADARRAGAIRPLREPAARPEPAATSTPVETPVSTGNGSAHTTGTPTRAPAAPKEPPATESATTPVRLSRAEPAPRPAPAATARADEADGDLDVANYGWTEFWSWARSRGYTDRKSLDAVVGRSTAGMTPLEIRRQIQARQATNGE